MTATEALNLLPAWAHGGAVAAYFMLLIALAVYLMRLLPRLLERAAKAIDQAEQVHRAPTLEKWPGERRTRVSYMTDKGMALFGQYLWWDLKERAGGTFVVTTAPGLYTAYALPELEPGTPIAVHTAQGKTTGRVLRMQRSCAPGSSQFIDVEIQFEVNQDS